MLNPWFKLSWDAASMAAEANMVIALRMARFAAGGARAQAEAQRMVTEKLAALAEAQVATAFGAMTGTSAVTAAGRVGRIYRKRVRANRRRLGRAK